MSSAVPLATVVIIGSHADQGSNLLARELPEFGQAGELVLLFTLPIEGMDSSSSRLACHRGEFLMLCSICFSTCSICRRIKRSIALMLFSLACGPLQAAFLHLLHLQQLVAPLTQRSQSLRLGVGQRT